MKKKFKKSIQNSRVVNCGRILEKPFNCNCCKKTLHVICRLFYSLSKKKGKKILIKSFSQTYYNIPTHTMKIFFQKQKRSRGQKRFAQPAFSV